ncbi:hypothetical protein BdWA1_000967 [Babesia duncani]|uniref:Uncharacterized protein n=1 Tax=Babesia duncani TaxID=323732 RepID=A0AAD9UQB5_9APIC|nr:hypothetical protein BdWA1_000967 [Babesia duncani]
MDDFCDFAIVSDQLRVVLEDSVSSLNLKGQVLEFKSGSVRITTEELYSLFNAKEAFEALNAGSMPRFNDDFKYTIDLIANTPSNVLHLSYIYPILRKVLVLIESFVTCVSEVDQGDQQLMAECNNCLFDPSVFRTLDHLYRSYCNYDSDIKRMLEVITKCFFKGRDDMGAVIDGIIYFYRVTFPVIEYISKNRTDNLLEYTIAACTFGIMQRLASYIVLVLLQDTITKGSGGDGENLQRVKDLFRLTLDAEVKFKFSHDILWQCLQHDVLRPCLQLIQVAFKLTLKVFYINRELVQVFLVAVLRFIDDISSESQNKLIVRNSIVPILMQLLNSFLQLLIKIAQQVSWYLVEIYPQASSFFPANIDTQEQCKDHRVLIKMLKKYLYYGESFSKAVTLLIHSVMRCYSLSRSEIFQHAITKLIEETANVICRSDALRVFSAKGVSSEITSSLEVLVVDLKRFLKHLSRELPLETFTATFYSLGSCFYANVNAQLLCFSIVARKHYKTSPGCIAKMVKELVTNSRQTYTQFIKYQNASSLDHNHLSLDVNLVALLTMMDLSRTRYPESFGMTQCLLEWCHSEYLTEYMLGRCICRLVSRLAKNNSNFIGAARHLLDTLLGVCMYRFSINQEPTDEQGLYFQLDAEVCRCFVCLGAFFECGMLLEWAMDNVILCYTCACITKIGEALGISGHEDSCSCFFCNFECSFGANCPCMHQPIVNEFPSIPHLLELIKALPWDLLNSTDQETTKYQSDSDVQVLQYLLDTLVNLLTSLEEFLTSANSYPNKIDLLWIALNLSTVLVRTGHYGTKPREIVLILKFYAMLGNVNESAGPVYWDAIRSALWFFQRVYDSCTITAQLKHLHQGFLTLLVQRNSSNPTVLAHGG